MIQSEENRYIMKIDIEITKCEECAFFEFDYWQDMSASVPFISCKKDAFAILGESKQIWQGIHKNCPFLKKEKG